MKNMDILSIIKIRIIGLELIVIISHSINISFKSKKKKEIK